MDMDQQKQQLQYSANDMNKELIEDVKEPSSWISYGYNYKVKIVDENGNEFAEDEKGEIVIIGKSVS